ncbi:MAG: LysM peptidoglycan-binding domain-containing protein [Lachnospiraceae bacterium]|jgi:hypothetical protein
MRSIGRNLIYIVVLAALTALLLLANPFHLFSIPAAADNAQSSYETYAVEEGDTLWSIADEHLCDAYPDHNAYIAEVRRANNMNNSNIYEHELLLIPVEAK